MEKKDVFGLKGDRRDVDINKPYEIYVNVVVHVCLHFIAYESTLYPLDSVALFSPFCTTASWTISEKEIICIYCNVSR